jgi:predicted RND superfamily exporter protein
VINLTAENHEIFGEQDSLIVVLEFPEPPGEARRPFIEGLGEALKQVPGVQRVLYKFMDLEDPDRIKSLFQRFLLGMNEREREAIQAKFNFDGLRDAFRRNRNRLFLTENPYMQKRILADPLELAPFVADAMEKRLGRVSLGDTYLFLASPDSTTYLIHVTPSFPSANIVKGKELVVRLRKFIPKQIASLTKSIPGAEAKFDGLKWHLTGKTVFHCETDELFGKEVAVILTLSFVMVSSFLLFIYRSFLSVGVLMAPIAVAVGGNYAIMYLSYNEINPVVVGSTGILFGLGTDYGVHLWGRLREEMDKGTPQDKGVMAVLERAGPPVTLGALTSIIAFLCLCLSDHPAMGQFGYVCATGVALALVASLFLFPAQAALIGKRAKGGLPMMRVTFQGVAGLFTKYPGLVSIAFATILVLSLIFTSRISYEKDLFKVFLARGLNSTAVADLISRKFGSNFSQPTLLSFDVDDADKGLAFQRQLDAILGTLMHKRGVIATIDSISYLEVPRYLQTSNVDILRKIVVMFPSLRNLFRNLLASSDFAAKAKESLIKGFDRTENIFREAVQRKNEGGRDDPYRLERSWYQARINGNIRFLTRIRYSDTVNDPDSLKEADQNILDAVQALPIEVKISGPRQSMEAILATLVSELLRLGLYAVLFVVILFFVVFRHPIGVALSLVPMTGAFFVTLGVMGAMHVGIPFSIIGVAPLIFGLGIDNGIHVIMRAFQEQEGGVVKVMEQMTRLLVVTSLTSMLGFLSMVMSSHYSLEFLGWAMVIGMGATLVFTTLALPALLLLLEKRGAARHVAQLIQ